LRAVECSPLFGPLGVQSWLKEACLLLPDCWLGSVRLAAGFHAQVRRGASCGRRR